MAQVLILGGGGRIGRSVARDVLTYTEAEIVITARNPQRGQRVAAALGERVRFLALDLADQQDLGAEIARSSLVIHTAGPFHFRDARVLKTCIEMGVNYLDVSDHRSFTLKALEYQDLARTAGVTAVVNTGIFPGISNSMVRQDVEVLDRVDRIHLSYVVAGSGGAGKTVMRTTFLGLQHPFEVWIEGQWQTIHPYSDRETVCFPAPYGPVNVYWFDMPEAFTLPKAFQARTVITKFGSVPDFYNQITWAIAHGLPETWLQHPGMMEFLTWGSYTTTRLTDRFSGIGVAIRSEVLGEKAGQPHRVSSTLVHPNTAIAAGYGTGSLAELILAGELAQPGVWPVEEILPTPLFQRVMAARGVKIAQTCQPGVGELSGP